MNALTLMMLLFIILLLINAPIAFVIGVSGIVWFLANGTIPLSIAVQRVIAQTQSISFLAVPFFILAGNLDRKSVV